LPSRQLVVGGALRLSGDWFLPSRSSSPPAASVSERRLRDPDGAAAKRAHEITLSTDTFNNGHNFKVNRRTMLKSDIDN
jgi:hypothetical protein